MEIENEVKYKAKNLLLIKKKLALCGFKLQKKVFHHDYYFSPPHKSFAGSRKYYLRLRRQRQSTEFSYHIVKNNLQTQELEVKVDDFKIFLQILKLLDFKTDCEVRKERFIYKKGEIRVMLDRVSGLGNFVEIEYCGKLTKKVEREFNKLITFFQLKRTDKVSGVGYPDLLRKRYD